MYMYISCFIANGSYHMLYTKLRFLNHCSILWLPSNIWNVIQWPPRCFELMLVDTELTRTLSWGRTAGNDTLRIIGIPPYYSSWKSFWGTGSSFRVKSSELMICHSDYILLVLNLNGTLKYSVPPGCTRDVGRKKKL